MRRVDDDGVERAECDQEDGAERAYAEDGDAEWQPGGDRHRAQRLDGRVHQPRRQRAPADQDAKRHPRRDRQQEALAHPLRREQHVGQPRAAVGVQPEGVVAERPVPPAHGHGGGRRQDAGWQPAEPARRLPQQKDHRRQRQGLQSGQPRGTPAQPAGGGGADGLAHGSTWGPTRAGRAPRRISRAPARWPPGPRQSGSAGPPKRRVGSRPACGTSRPAAASAPATARRRV